MFLTQWHKYISELKVHVNQKVSTQSEIYLKSMPIHWHSNLGVDPIAKNLPGSFEILRFLTKKFGLPASILRNPLKIATVHKKCGAHCLNPPKSFG